MGRLESVLNDKVNLPSLEMYYLFHNANYLLNLFSTQSQTEPTWKSLLKGKPIRSNNLPSQHPKATIKHQYHPPCQPRWSHISPCSPSVQRELWNTWESNKDESVNLLQAHKKLKFQPTNKIWEVLSPSSPLPPNFQPNGNPRNLTLIIRLDINSITMTKR